MHDAVNSSAACWPAGQFHKAAGTGAQCRKSVFQTGGCHPRMHTFRVQARRDGTVRSRKDSILSSPTLVRRNVAGMVRTDWDTGLTPA